MSDKIIIGNNEFEVIVAVTEQQQAKGLMGVPWPPPVMAFPYDFPGTRKFWMKNTVSPLDIIFCNAGKVVAILEGEPMSTKNIGPDCLCDLVVEMPKGMAVGNNIKIGDPIKLRRSLISVAKQYEAGPLKKFGAKY
jgi:uncharacterized membrane protein (UPF0127 family)